jgi:uncharacterized protein with PIN domain
MSLAFFTFHPELHFFLPPNKRNITIALPFKGRQTLKHLVESLGVPHTELGEITVNGQARGLDHVPHNGDRIELRAASGCPSEPRFLLDSHLGRLAAYLRMSGFDSLYENNYSDDSIAEILVADPRILLTRDRRLLMRKAVCYGYCLRSLEPPEQLAEVLRRFDLADKVTPFRRCLRCNHSLQAVSKEAVLDRLEPLTRLYFDEFYLCSTCNQVYWKGSHVVRMQKIIEHAMTAQLDCA